MASVHLAAPPALQQLEYLGLGQQGLGEALLQIQIQSFSLSPSIVGWAVFGQFVEMRHCLIETGNEQLALLLCEILTVCD